MEVNPDRKLSEAPKAVDTDNFPETPSGKPPLKAMPCIPLDVVGTAEWRVWYYLSNTLPRYNIISLEGKP